MFGIVKFNKNSKKGFVLFYVVLLSAVCTTLAVLTWHGCLLQKKMLHQLTRSMQSKMALIEQAQAQEQNFYDHFSFEHATPVNFVPDTLEFGEAFGVEYFELCNKKSTYAVHSIQGMRLH